MAGAPLAIICTLAVLAVWPIVNCDPMFGAENVCNKTTTVRRDVTIQEPVKYELTSQGMCGIFPCTKTRVEYRTDSKLKTIHEDIVVAACCEGYAETPDRRCAPICLKSCNSGKCVRPNVCKCNPEPSDNSPGFVGSTCSRFVCLAPNRWGSRCDLECNCPPNSYCSGSTGNCLCRAGWRGANCSEECEPSMGCEEVELPPIIEPEANVISDSMGPSQRLVAPRATDGALDEENGGSVTVTRELSKPAYMGINFILVFVTCLLLCTLMWYRKRMAQLRDQIYAAAAYSSTSGGSNGGASDYYTATTIYSDSANKTGPRSVANRPRMPAPGEPDFLGKNLSFASATRNIILKGLGQPGKQEECQDKFIVDPKVESHLVSSQKASKQNIYSDLESNFSDRAYTVEQPASRPAPTSNDGRPSAGNTLTIRVSGPNEDHTYQVPRSPRSAVVLESQSPDPHESSYANESDEAIYEEIKPRSPSANQRQQ